MCLLKVLVLEWGQKRPVDGSNDDARNLAANQGGSKNQLEFSACSAAGGYQFCDPEGPPLDRKTVPQKTKNAASPRGSGVLFDRDT
jgi:hypothetical protein